MRDSASYMFHPDCTICAVPMWLISVEMGDWADHQHFECVVCDQKINRTMRVEAQRIAGQ